MKELTIEEKAKHYDEAIKRLEDIKTGKCQKTFMYTEGLFDYIFPELKESEDEKIIHWIRKELETKYVTDNIVNDVMADKAFAWLWKHEEHKSADNVEPKFKVGDKIISTITNIPYYITEVCNGHYLTDVGCVIMFNAQDNFELSKQNSAWSEEDENMIRGLIAICDGWAVRHSYYPVENCDIEMLKNWLKSIKGRYTWKPSNDQMKALNAINVTGGISYAGQGQELINLYNDLKKLREE